MSLKNLPSGQNFRTKVGAGNFNKKLNQVTKVGSLKHLQDNRDSIVKALKPMEKLIRQGRFGRIQRIRTLKKIKELEGGNLTYVDKRDIKKILSHVSSQSLSAQATSQRSDSAKISSVSAMAQTSTGSKSSLIKNQEPAKATVIGRRSLVRRAEARGPEDFSVPGRERMAPGGLLATRAENRARLNGGGRVAGESNYQSSKEALPNRFGVASQAASPTASGLAVASQTPLSRGATTQASLHYERMARLGSGEAARNLQKQAFSKLQSAGGSTRPLGKR